MNKLSPAPLTVEEQQCLDGIGQLAGLDAQAKALRLQLGSVIARAQQDDGFNTALIEYVYALQHDGDEQSARLVAAMCAGRMWSVELSDRMRSESGGPPLTPQEKAARRASQRAWDLAHGVRPSSAIASRLFDTPEATRVTLQTILAIVATAAFIGLMVVLNHVRP